MPHIITGHISLIDTGIKTVHFLALFAHDREYVFFSVVCHFCNGNQYVHHISDTFTQRNGTVFIT